MAVAPKCCKYPFLGCKNTWGDIRLYFKNYEKNYRWCHHWKIRHLSVKTKISPLFGCPQGSQGCQKMRHDPLNLDLEVWCSNIQPKFQKLWNSTKNHSFLMACRGFLKFIQFRQILQKRAPCLVVIMAGKHLQCNIILNDLLEFRPKSNLWWRECWKATNRP